MKYNIAILGATGAVGQELLSILEERIFPLGKLTLLASKRSAGKKIRFKHREETVYEAGPQSFNDQDFVFSSASTNISAQLIHPLPHTKTFFIDNTSFFRMQDDVPLVVPEINFSAIKPRHRVIANPNCNAIILATALGPLHKLFKIKRLFISTYQAASGAGLTAMRELVDETAAYLDQKSFARTVIPYPYAFNCFLHNSRLLENNYCEEEQKVINELKKIFDDQSIKINVNCVRVPVLRAHSLVCNVKLARKTSVREITAALNNSPGVKVIPMDKAGLWPTPLDAAGQDEVLAGRIREDISCSGAFDIWLVCDQLRKGAALNAVQIAEKLIKTN